MIDLGQVLRYQLVLWLLGLFHQRIGVVCGGIEQARLVKLGLVLARASVIQNIAHIDGRGASMTSLSHTATTLVMELCLN